MKETAIKHNWFVFIYKSYIISQHILSIHSDNKYSNMKINSILGKLHWNKIQWKILIFKNIFENSEIFFNDFYIGISLLFFLCPVLCRDILILDNYLTPRNGEQDISEECNEAGNEYLIALGTVSIFSWLTSHQTLRKDSFWVRHPGCCRNRNVQPTGLNLSLSNSGLGIGLMQAPSTPAQEWPPTRTSSTSQAPTLAVFTLIQSSLTNPR